MISVHQFVGVIYDISSDTIIDRCTVERMSEEAALEDATKLCDLKGHPADMAYIYNLQFKAIVFNN